MNNSWKLAATVFSSAALFAGLHGAAQADLFTISNDYSNANAVTITNNGVTDNYEAGRYFASINNGPTINVFCIDISNEILPPASYTTDDSEGTTFGAGPLQSEPAGYYYNGGLVSALNSTDYKVQTGGLTLQQRANAADYLAGTYLASPPTLNSANYTAIQLAIWDIVQDGGDGLSTGSFTASAVTIGSYGTLAASYEAQALANDGNHISLTDWIQAPRPGNSGSAIANHVQEFVGLPSDLHPQGSPVPEPGPLAMLASLGAAVGGLMLKRLRTRPTA